MEKYVIEKDMEIELLERLIRSLESDGEYIRWLFWVTDSAEGVTQRRVDKHTLSFLRDWLTESRAVNRLSINPDNFRNDYEYINVAEKFLPQMTSWVTTTREGDVVGSEGLNLSVFIEGNSLYIVAGDYSNECAPARGVNLDTGLARDLYYHYL